MAAPNRGTFAEPEREIGRIVSWFADRGYRLEVQTRADGSFQVFYRISDRLRRFGVGTTPLEAARHAQAALQAGLNRRAAD